jgi:hypothetical protein
MSARERKVVRWLIFGFGGLYVLAMGGCVLGRMGNCAALSVPEQRSALLAVALTVLTLWGGLFTSGFLPVIQNQGWRLMVGALPGLISLATLYLLTRLSFGTVSQLLVAVFWAVVPMGIVGGLVFGLEEAVYRQGVMPDGSGRRS